MSDSNFNPYQAPNPQGAPAATPPPIGQSFVPTSAWDITTSFKSAWEVFKQHWLVFVGSFTISIFASWIITSGFEGICLALIALFLSAPEHVELAVIGYKLPSELLGLTIDSFFQVGILRLSLAALRGQNPDIMLLFSGVRQMPSLLIFTILLYAAVAFGLLLLIVPGIYLAIRLSLGSLIISDKQLTDEDKGPLYGLRRSWELTRGHEWKLLVFSLATIAAILLGCSMLLVGVLVTIPLSTLAFSLVYLRLTQQLTVFEIAAASDAPWGR